jgi:hypothetical protein
LIEAIDHIPLSAMPRWSGLPGWSLPPVAEWLAFNALALTLAYAA